MMRKKLTLVLGAGASAEFKMPVGSELKNIIASKFDFEFEPFDQMPKRGDHLLFRALTRLEPEYPQKVEAINDHLDAGRHIRRAVIQAPSIDEFIDNQRDDYRVATCGKIAIVRCILEMEKRSILYHNESGDRTTIDFGAIEETWCAPFFRLLIEGSNIRDVGEKFASINIISFNYDRCILHFLFNAIMNYFNCSENLAAETLSRLRVIFPYGSVAELPWQGSRQHVKFGGDISGEKLFDLAGNIKTFTEQIDDEAIISDLQLALRESSMLVFLGFAYHPQNMRIISAQDGNEKEIFGTTYGLSDFDRNHISAELSKMYTTNQNSIFLSNTKCENLFHEYSRAFKLIDI